MNHCHTRRHCYVVFSELNHQISYEYKHNNNALADNCSNYLPTYILTYFLT